MSIIDRPTSRHRATPTAARIASAGPGVLEGTAAPTPLGGRYVSISLHEPRNEGSYVSTGVNAAPATRGTYVSTPALSPRVGGRYTYTS